MEFELRYSQKLFYLNYPVMYRKRRIEFLPSCFRQIKTTQRKYHFITKVGFFFNVNWQTLPGVTLMIQCNSRLYLSFL